MECSTTRHGVERWGSIEEGSSVWGGNEGGASDGDPTTGAADTTGASFCIWWEMSTD
jgi:hypothetical protein